MTEGSKRGGRLVYAIVALAMCLVTVPAVDAATPTPTSTDMVTVEVLNALSLQPLRGLTVTAKKRTGDTYAAVASATTDSAGRATVKLTGISSGVRFVFTARPYNGGIAQSADVTKAGTFRFLVGTLPVSVVAGGTNAPLAAAKVTVKERLADGTAWAIGSATTDSNGLVILDPPGLGSGRVYLLEAISPWDGLAKRSNEIRDVAGMTFVVGNAPLRVTLIDAISNAPLAGRLIDVYERVADGKLQGRRQATTNAVGGAIFDLEGLGNGRVYVVRVWKGFNDLIVDSEDLRAAGEFLFKIGTLSVRVVDGTGKTLPGTKIDVYEKLADGTQPWVKGGLTDAAGVIRLDLAGLGRGRKYLLRAKSPIDGSNKYSNEIALTGQSTFTVGSAPLRLTVVDAISGAASPALSVGAYERLADGTAGSAYWRTTDTAGKATFDLPGLGTGRTYFLVTWPYGTGKAQSDDLTSAGDYTFRVGKLEVTVVNGADGTPLAVTDVSAVEKQADGTFKWAAGGKTDGRGIIRFDLPGLGQGRIYALDAKSPSDGSSKRSDNLTQNGRYTFAVGRAPLRVRVINGISGDPVGNLRVSAYRKLAPEQLEWAASRTTDAGGRAVFDLSDLGSGTTFVLAATPYNGGTVYSDELREADTYDLRVGTVELTMRSPIDGMPVAAVKVSASVKNADGTLTWTKQGTADAQGIIRFDLPGLGSGRIYVFDTKSLSDGSGKRSQDITVPGKHVFTIGSRPLTVTVKNGRSGAVRPDLSLTAYELPPEGGKKWAANRITDAGGRAIFDLDGLGSGRVYVFTVKPYNGGTITSDEVAAPGAVDFRVGTIPVTVIDDDNGVPIAGLRIAAYVKRADETRAWAAEGTADETGTVQFDLPGISQTIVGSPATAASSEALEYAFRAIRPFDNGREYWSAWITQEAPVVMRVQRNVGQPLDFTSPTVRVLSPSDGGVVDAAGFSLLGEASDNTRIDRVVAVVSDEVRGVSQLSTTYDAGRRQWTATVTAAMISPGRTVSVAVMAYDAAQNRASAVAALRVVTDAAAPQVRVLSPASGGSVPRSGFLVSGTATDDIGVVNLVATVDDPLLGRTVNQTLGVAPGGAWSFAVLSGQVSEGQTATVTVVGRDAKNKQGSAVVQVRVTGVDFLAHHVVNRITFGSNPDLLAQVRAMGVDAFLDQQLNPQAIDDAALNALLPAAAPTTKAELQRQTLVRMIYSRRQLLEVLTQFWDNHFNTDLNKTLVVAYEVNENALFRQRALGRFRDLLGASAKSPAMLVYLDQAASLRGQPNENYARELMELHTLGVDGGYTQTDVEQVARAFTGWTVRNGAFAFDGNNHDAGQKMVLGQALPAGRGIEDGEQVLDILAAHPSTARFVCTKLAQLLVGDAPTANMVERCVAEYLANDGQIGAVVRLLVRSPEFGAAAAFRAKVRTPVEMAVFWARALGASSDANGLIAPISEMGMRLFENPVPTGWSETGDDWINSNLLLQRSKHVNRLVRNQIGGTTVDLRAFFTRNGQSTADGIAGFLLQQLFHADFTPLEYDTAVGVLTDDGARPFNIDQSDAAVRLQQLVGTVMSFPGGQYQ